MGTKEPVDLHRQVFHCFYTVRSRDGEHIYTV